MLWIDLLITIVVLGAGISGALKGAAGQILRLVALFVAFTESWRIAPWIREAVLPYLDIESGGMTDLLVLILSLVLLYAIVYMLGRFVVSFFEGGALGWLNRLLGAILGMVIAVYILGYLFSIADKIVPPKPSAEDTPREQIDIRLRSEYYSLIRDSIHDLEDIREYFSKGK